MQEELPLSTPYCSLELPSGVSTEKNTTCTHEPSFAINEPNNGATFYLPIPSHARGNNNITVYDEVKEMLLSAIIMYGVVHLRDLARRQLEYPEEHTISTSLAEQLMKLPISAREIVRLVSQHRDDIIEQVGREATVDLYLTAFDTISDTTSSRELELELNPTTLQVTLVSFDVMVVEDDNSGNELVYAICVDTARRRITVSFRGCSTRTDWFICAQTFLKQVENPLFFSSSMDDNPSGRQNGGRWRQQSPTINVHSGYYNYLFSKAPGGTETECKFESIMRHLKRLLAEYPGYNIYVTGHSLGAALATVFTFFAASDQTTLVPIDENHERAPTITCINFASPMTGNVEFETAFRELEDQGRIRCLRVTNYYDIFTQLPDRGNWLYVLAFSPCIGVHLLPYIGASLLFFICFQNRVYRHVGMNLQMYRGHSSLRRCCLWPFRKHRWSRNETENDSSGGGVAQQQQQQYWYKMKHSHGTPDYFLGRVVQDFEKHMKQLVQRALALPFLTDFNANHKAYEHLQRLTGLEQELGQVQLDDLYAVRANTSSLAGASPHSSSQNGDTRTRNHHCCFVV